MKTCNECYSEVPDQAAVCRACGRRIVGRACPECAELSKLAARRCSHCGHDFARERKTTAIEPFVATAALVPTIVHRGRFIPQEIHILPEKITIKTWGIFRLSHTNEEIPWEKIAGYHYHSGWFWDSIEIQTRGQKANSIQGVPKPSGERIRVILEQMKE